MKYKKVLRIGEGAIIKAQCPGCKVWAELDDDQFQGKVSLDCTECDFHETINLAKDGEMIDGYKETSS